MSLAMTLFSMIAAWMAIAMSMLWGMLRIARRHQADMQAPAQAEVACRYWRGVNPVKALN